MGRGTGVWHDEDPVHLRRSTCVAAVRAVANACGANHLAVAIPCHRVVRQGGELAGYRWGVERKRELLRREAAESGNHG